MSVTKRVCLVLAVLLLAQGAARAERIRFRYAAADIANAGGVMTAGTPNAVTAERIPMFGARECVQCRLRPTHMVGYRHPTTGAMVNVPIRFPEGQPRIEHRGSRIVYNYGSYTIEVAFIADGSVEVDYNSPGRPLGWCNR